MSTETFLKESHVGKNPNWTLRQVHILDSSEITNYTPDETFLRFPEGFPLLQLLNDTMGDVLDGWKHFFVRDLTGATVKAEGPQYRPALQKLRVPTAYKLGGGTGLWTPNSWMWSYIPLRRVAESLGNPLDYLISALEVFQQSSRDGPLVLDESAESPARVAP